MFNGHGTERKEEKEGCEKENHGTFTNIYRLELARYNYLTIG